MSSRVIPDPFAVTRDHAFASRKCLLRKGNPRPTAKWRSGISECFRCTQARPLGTSGEWYPERELPADDWCLNPL
jgi:hypothetical protein